MITNLIPNYSDTATNHTHTEEAHTHTTNPTEVNTNTTEHSNKYTKPPTQHKKQTIPSEFMTSDKRLKQCADTIESMLSSKLSQEGVDGVYEDMLSMYCQEIGDFLKEIKRTPKSKKAVKWTRKAYWCEELSECWLAYHEAEKQMLGCRKYKASYQNLRESFLLAQKNFDKLLRKKCRSYERRVHHLEKVNENDPVEFWRCISRMGPKASKQVPWEVLDEEGNSIFDEAYVLNKWKCDFQDLLMPPTPTDLAKLTRQ